jgi:hypothetical protein
MVQKPINQTDEADFELLKLVERPNSKMNSPNLPKTLEDCEGYLTQLPLVPPNSDKKSSNIANMDNILTLTEAQDNFSRAAESMTDNEAAPGSGIPPRLFDEKTSPAMKQLLRMANKQCCHVRAPGVSRTCCPSWFGIVLQPRWKDISSQRRTPDAYESQSQVVAKERVHQFGQD